MDAKQSTVKSQTTVERPSDRELVMTRTFNGSARTLYAAWTKPALFRRWWVPKSCGITLESCDMDVRVDGTYRLVFGGGAAFHGRYLEVTPNARIRWTNEEAGDGGPVTTVTFEEHDGQTRVVVHDLHPTKAALDEARASGGEEGTLEALEQLDAMLASPELAADVA